MSIVIRGKPPFSFWIFGNSGDFGNPADDPVSFCGAVAGNLKAAESLLLRVSLALQIVWLFVLAVPIAAIAWTVTHEEIFREPREFCARRSDDHPRLAGRKFFYIFTCEYCFSHYVAIFFLAITRYKLLYDDWRGYLVGGFALVWIANQYMSIYAHLRLDIRRDRIEIKHVEKKVEKLEETKAA